MPPRPRFDRRAPVRELPNINERIKYPQLRVVDSDGKQLGVIDRIKALEIASQRELDLVLVSEKANPPVCRIMDYGKYKFEQEKKAKEAKKIIDSLINLGCSLQETREILTNEIDWRIKCGSRIIVSTPREDIGASMLIAEDLSKTINVPVEVVPMEELEKVLSNSNNGTIVTSRYFIQPLEKVAKQHEVRAIAVDLSDFQKELKILKELNAGSCVGIVSISPGLLRAAEVIIHSMRGGELILMTAVSDNNSRLLSLLKASNHIVCDGPSLSVVENTLLKNRSQLMRLPQIICAKNYLSIETINQLKKEIGVIC